MKIILLVGIILAIMLYLSFLISGGGLNVLESFTGLGESQGTFTMYYMNGCPHCESILPEYRNFVASGQLDNNGKKTTIRMLEQADPNAAPELEAHNVKGFPTFILSTVDGKNIEYSGERSVEAMKDFIIKNSS
jgi:thioredoxin-related protein